MDDRFPCPASCHQIYVRYFNWGKKTKMNRFPMSNKDTLFSAAMSEPLGKDPYPFSENKKKMTDLEN